MDSSLFKFFLIAIIVQFCHSSSEAAKNNSNSSPPSLSNIMKEQKDESEREKQHQREPASFRDKVITPISKGSESSTAAGKSKMTPTKGAKNKNNLAKLNINEPTNAVEVRLQINRYVD
jgi:hypothetical protein